MDNAPIWFAVGAAAEDNGTSGIPTWVGVVVLAAIVVVAVFMEWRWTRPERDRRIKP